MKKVFALCLLACPGLSLAQASQECRVLVAKEWIVVGATSLSSCLQYADEAATPGERQFAKIGDTYLKVQGQVHYQSADGGNTWEPIMSQQSSAGFGSLNVLQPTDASDARPADTMSSHAPPAAKKKKRRRRYH